MGYSSLFVPILCLALSTYASFRLCHLYGIALAAVGHMANLPTNLSIDAFGPIADNACGISKMCNLQQSQEICDNLDDAGNSTAAIGKGFSISAAYLVSVAIFAAFASRAGIIDVNILNPL
jgi:Na+/H+-translocating membrane pyrophosphatase